MKAITLTQPWATLVALGQKRIETRSWKTNYRGPLAIHAATNFTDDGRHLCDEEPFRSLLGGDMRVVLWKGFVLCTCNLTDCFKMTPEWIATVKEPELSFGYYDPDRYAWILDDIKPIRPFRVKGCLGLWNLDDDRLHCALVGGR